MKKSLLVWGALIVIALCFVGCCYYTTNHNHCPPCPKHKHCCAPMNKACPGNNDADDTVETMTVEAVEIIPATGPAAAPAATPAKDGQKDKTMEKTPKAGQKTTGYNTIGQNHTHGNNSDNTKEESK